MHMRNLVEYPVTRSELSDVLRESSHAMLTDGGIGSIDAYVVFRLLRAVDEDDRLAAEILRAVNDT